MDKESMPTLYTLYQELKAIFEVKVETPQVVPDKKSTPPPVPPQPPVKAVKKAFTEQQIEAMKELKKKLSVDDNAQLHPFIERWSGGKLKTASELNGDNIDEFMGYLKSLL